MIGSVKLTFNSLIRTKKEVSLRLMARVRSWLGVVLYLAGDTVDLILVSKALADNKMIRAVVNEHLVHVALELEGVDKMGIFVCYLSGS